MKQALTVYIDGEQQVLQPDEFKKLSPGFLNGFGVFETLLCEKRKIYFLEEHYRRFVYGCDRYILPRPPDAVQIKKILAELIKVNCLQNARARFCAWRKSYDVHFAAAVVPREPFPEKMYREGFAACVYPKVLDRSPELARIKSLDYRFFLNAYEHALQNGCHEAILLSSSGSIVEGSRSNIFLVKKNKILTPALSSGCLSGVARQAALTAAKRARIKALSAELTIADLFKCEEAFVTNSLIGVMPLTFLGEHRIGCGLIGPVTKRVMKAYKEFSRTRGDFLL